MYEKVATCFFINDREAELIFLGGEYKSIEENESVENCSEDYTTESNAEPEVKGSEVRPIYYM